MYRDNFVFLKFCTKNIGAGVKISVPGQSGIISIIEYSLSWLHESYFVLKIVFLI